MKNLLNEIKENKTKYITLIIGVFGILVTSGKVIITEEVTLVIQIISYFLTFYGFDKNAEDLIGTIGTKK